MQLKEASILVVDDEPSLRKIFSRWFDGVTAQVFVAENGVHALEVLGANRIDLIVSDVRMPVMDGIGLLKAIKAQGIWKPSVIFISGFADLEVREVYDLGAEALLEKPIVRQDLIHAAQRALLERYELWQKPLDLDGFRTLADSFASLAQAIEDHRIAFGRGGFCIETEEVLAEGAVNVKLDFKADQYVLSGQGTVRWLALHERQAGIELTWVNEESRARAVELTGRSASFIPRHS